MKQKTFPMADKELPLSLRPVIEHARTLIMENGIRNFTIEKLAAEMRISKKTIYKHFASRGEFVEAVLLYNFTDLFRKIEELPATYTDPIKHVYEILCIIINHLSVINSNTVYELKLYYPNVWQRIEQFRYNILKELAGCFEKAQALGLVRKDIKIDYFTGIIINAAQSVFQPEFFIKYPYSLSEMIKSYIDFILNGIMEQGHRFDVESLEYEKP